MHQSQQLRILLSEHNGIDAGNKPINNVANGEIFPDSKQAINGSQIFPIVNQINLHEQHLHGINNRVTNLENEWQPKINVLKQE